VALVVATEGCCAGHGCDGCKTCQRGHCCRSDNPDYRLPETGDWEGPIYGSLGVVAHPDGDRAECHICGELAHNVPIHAFWAHDVNVREYRAIFGFNAAASLVSYSHAAHLRQRAIDKESGARLTHDATPAGFTPEQWQAYLKAHIARGARRDMALGKPSWRASRFATLGQVHHTGEQRLMIGRLRYEGVPVADLAQRFGVSEATIRRIVREYAKAHGSPDALPRLKQRYANSLKTHCGSGHPFDEHNTYLNKRGHRMCRACGRERMRAQRDRAESEKPGR
jgi:hypothetical protein